MSAPRGRIAITLRAEQEFSSRNQPYMQARMGSDTIRNSKFRENNFKQGTVFPTLGNQQTPSASIAINIKRDLNKTNNGFTQREYGSVPWDLGKHGVTHEDSFEAKRKRQLMAFRLSRISQDQQQYQAKLHSSNISRLQEPTAPSRVNMQTVQSHGIKEHITKHYSDYAKIFEDTSLSTTTLRKERMYRSIERMKQKAEKIRQESLDQQRKAELIKFYQTQFGVSLSPRQAKFQVKFIDRSQLEVLLEEKLVKKRQQVAAVEIQRAFKGFMARKYIKVAEKERDQAARTIQIFWKWYLEKKVSPRKLGKQQWVAAKLIQKYMKGYLVQKRMIQELSKLKISLCHEYFNSMRLQIYEDSQIIIAYHFRKHLKRKKHKEEVRLRKQQQLEAQKKKKNKLPIVRQPKEKSSPMNKLKNLTTTVGHLLNQNSSPAGKSKLDQNSPGPKTNTLDQQKPLTIKVASTNSENIDHKSPGEPRQFYKYKAGDSLGQRSRQDSKGSPEKRHSRQGSSMGKRRASTTKQILKESPDKGVDSQQDLKEEQKSENEESLAQHLGLNELQEITQEDEDFGEDEGGSLGSPDLEGEEENS